jgi:hypothetical protein
MEPICRCKGHFHEGDQQSGGLCMARTEDGVCGCPTDRLFAWNNDTTPRPSTPALYAHLGLVASVETEGDPFPFGWWVTDSADPDDDEAEQVDGGFHDVADEDRAEWIAKADLFLMGHGFFVHTDWTGDDLVTTAMVTRDNTAELDTERTVSVNVPARMSAWLEGTQVAADLTASAGRTPTEVETSNMSDPIAQVIVALRAARSRADGSTTVRLSAEQLRDLATYAGYLADSCSDNVGSGDMGALAELNAARATVRRVAAALAKLV